MSPRTLGTAVRLGCYEPGSPDWVEARKGRLGASEIAAVLGLSKWRSPFSLWHLKAGNIAPDSDNREMAWGRDLEALIARRFAREHPGWGTSRCGLYVHRERDYQVAQPDRVLHFGRRRLGALEVKTDRYADDWGPQTTDDVPVYYRCQAMWQMDVFGWSECHFAVLITGVDYREYVVSYDPDEAELMRTEAVRFLDSITAGEPPDIDDHQATYRAVRQLHPDIDDCDAEIPAQLADEYLEAVEAYDYSAGVKQGVTTRVLDAMGSARRAVCNGQRIAIRVPSSNGGTPHLRPATRRTAA